MPELGGSRGHLDIIGINYYWTNQWELGRDEKPLPDDDPRRVPLRDLVKRVHDRYGGDLLITETAHVDDMRPRWLSYVADETENLLKEGIPLRGVCLYPILGMPEWHEQQKWTQMGLWELTQGHDGLERQVCQPMLEALRKAQRIECSLSASRWNRKRKFLSPSHKSGEVSFSAAHCNGSEQQEPKMWEHSAQRALPEKG